MTKLDGMVNMPKASMPALRAYIADLIDTRIEGYKEYSTTKETTEVERAKLLAVVNDLCDTIIDNA